MEKILFFDLEETLIKSWHNPKFCNVEFIKKIIEQEGTNQVHMFSFAIIDEDSKVKFETFFKKPLEDKFNIEIISFMSIDEIMEKVFFFTGITLDKFQFTSLWGKLKAFHDFCHGSFKDSECVLVDDIVPNSAFELPDKNLIIRTIKAPSN